MKKNWTNPEMNNLSVSGTKEDGSTYGEWTIKCSCCHQVFYDKNLGPGVDPETDPGFREARIKLQKHGFEVHGGGTIGCSA
ncbi:MAG: hypothetical protein RSD47_08825 [Romboutsia sp.]